MSNDSARTEPWMHRPRILIADADAEIRSLHRAALLVTGCDVVEAADGREALTKALCERRPLSSVNFSYRNRWLRFL
jgi:PleD family two-component response regulator